MNEINDSTTINLTRRLLLSMVTNHKQVLNISLLLLLISFTLVPICSNASAMVLLQGTITDRVTNAAIVGAKVTVNGAFSTTTDGNGNYTISDEQYPNMLSQGGSIIVQAQGYFATSGGASIVAPFPVTYNSTLLYGGSVLQGKVTDSTSNQPIANTSISYNSTDVFTIQGRNTYSHVLYTTTDLFGNYAIDSSNIFEGTATTGTSGTLSVSASNYLNISLPVNATIPYPFTQNIFMTPAPTVLLQGTITDRATNAAIVGAKVTVNGVFSTTTDGNGNYSISYGQYPNMPSQGGAVVVQAQGYFATSGAASIVAPFPVTYNSTLLHGGAVLQGNVTDATTKQPITNASISYNSTDVFTIQGFNTYSHILYTTTDLFGNYAIDSSHFFEGPATASTTGTLSVSASNYLNISLPVNATIPYPFTQNIIMTPAPTVLLQGTITDRATNAAIVGAKVTVNGAFSTTTDGNGNYSISYGQYPNMPSQGGAVVVQAQGYFATSGAASIVAPFPVTYNSTLLHGGAVLQGNVTDATTKQPITNASISYNSTDVFTIQGFNTYSHVLYTTTDLFGNYAIDSSHFFEGTATAGTNGTLSVTSNPGYVNYQSSLTANLPFPVARNVPLAETGVVSTITIDTVPSGLSITVDNTPYTSPQSFIWIPNTVHTIATISLLPIAPGNQIIFNNWSDNGAVAHSIATPVSNTTILANFTTQYLLSTVATPSSAGSVSAGGWFNLGLPVSIQATPNPGFNFIGFSGDMSGSGNPQTITMNAARTVTANFTATYTLTYTRGANGTITGSTSQAVNSGWNATSVTAVPNPGYHFVSWSDNVKTATRTDTNVTANISVIATFAINTFTVSYTPGADGTITGSTSQTVNYGGNATSVTAVPNTNYHFVSWSDNVTTATRTDTNVTGNISATATFAVAPTISGTPANEITAGTTYSFTPIASDAVGGALSFSITNQPAWATFNTVTGMLSGTPPIAGNYGNIGISVNDANGGSASLPAFSIIVTSSGGSGGTGTPVPVMDGWWLLPGMLAGFGIFARRRKG